METDVTLWEPFLTTFHVNRYWPEIDWGWLVMPAITANDDSVAQEKSMKVECVSCTWTGQLSDTDTITIADQEDVPACPECGDPVAVVRDVPSAGEKS